MIDFTDAAVCIIGLGLMGASAAQKINGHCKKLIGIDTQVETIAFALEKHWIDTGYHHLDELEEMPDIIVLAMPVGQILRFMDEDLLKIRTSCMVIDFGSTKFEIINKMKSLPINFQCFACHPMCGKETSGPLNSDPFLFTGKPFLYYAISKEEKALKVLLDFIKILDAFPIEMDPLHHDRQLAYISHVPYLMAAALSLISSTDETEPPEDLWEKAATGYHDMTRLAGSDISMMIDIMKTNPEQISMVLTKIMDQLSVMKSLLDQGQSAEMRDLLIRAKKLKERANQCRKS
jgi:prephenate dehydrogenase